MKKNCPNCGKKFDYDYSMGICPHCGKYDSPSALRDDSAKQDPPLLVNESVNKKPFVPKQKEHLATSTRKYSTISVVVMIIIIAMIIVIPIILEFREKEKIEKIITEQKVEEPKEVKEYIAQPFVVTVDDVDVEITIEDARPFVFEGVQAIEGWKYVEVCYKADSEVYFAGFSDPEVFLRWEDRYTEGLNVYDLSLDDENVIGMLYDDKSISSWIERGKGQWVFLIPQEVTEAAIEIYEKQNISGTKYQKLNKIHLVDIKVEG